MELPISPEPDEGVPRLVERLREAIRAEGSIGFDRFMEVALYDPEEGYYASGRAAIGRGGDFFTSASVGSLFGRLAGVQVAELGRATGGAWRLVEQGASDGRLAADLLAAGCRPPGGLVLVEPSPALERRQRATLEGFAEVAWCRRVEDLPPFRGVHFSNELADAFPVKAFRFAGGRWMERRVAWRDGAFGWVLEPEEGSLRLPEEALEGDEIEVAPGLAPWLAALGGAMREGYLLLIDYGDWTRRRAPGIPIRSSLAGYRGHRPAPDLLGAVGMQDLTARVDFARLVAAAEEAGFRFLGSADQHHFLIGLGAALFSGEETGGATWAKTARQFKALMHPELMGRSFEALLFSKGELPDGPFAGFGGAGWGGRQTDTRKSG